MERLGKLFELLNHRCVVVLGLRMNRQHARSVAYAEHLLARQLPVDIAGQCGQELDVFHVLLFVEHALVEVGDAPTQGNVEVEALR